MNEIICPHCHKAFKVDESGYAEILRQVRDHRFKEELQKRLELAEADKNNAVTYINNLRQRAYGNATGNITLTSLTPEFVLDERARELYWEGHRRTDLIRFGRFTTAAYLWPWKGGVKGGTGVSTFRNLFPLPSADVSSNPNLKQNTGY